MLCHGVIVLLTGLIPQYEIESPDVLRIDVSGLPGKAQPIRGDRLVRPDGTVSLGTYGSVRVTGLTPDQARAAVVRHLAGQMEKNREDRLEVRVEVAGFNSKHYRVYSNGGVARFPCTGDDTVIDAISRIQGAGLAAKSKVWLARPDPAGRPDRILPVDWNGIARDGDASTNYLIMPGDRMFIGGTPPK